MFFEKIDRWIAFECLKPSRPIGMVFELVLKAMNCSAGKNDCSL